MPPFKPAKQAHTNANKSQLTLLDFTGSKQIAMGRKRSNEHQTSSVTDPLPSSRLDFGTESVKVQDDSYTVDVFDDAFSDMENKPWVPNSPLALQEGNSRVDEGKASRSQVYSLSSGLGAQELPTYRSSLPTHNAPVAHKRQTAKDDLAEIPVNAASSSFLGSYGGDQVDSSISMREMKADQKRGLNVVQGEPCPCSNTLCLLTLIPWI